MADVVWASKFQLLVEKLTAQIDPQGIKIFPTNRDLIVFAAMLGYKNGIREKPDSQGKTIPLRIFESTGDDALIMLLALMSERDAEILRVDDHKDNEALAIAVFEEYANGGLSIIQSWLDENPLDSTGETTLLSKISEQLMGDKGIKHGQIKFD